MRRIRGNRGLQAAWAIAVLRAGAHGANAADDVDDLRKLIEAQSKQLEQQRKQLEQQQKQMEELNRRLETLRNGQDVKPVAATTNAQPADAPKSLELRSGAGKKSDKENNGVEEESPQPNLDEGGVKKIIDDFLKENPGSGMPPSVQTGFNAGQGFFIRSAPNPSYIPWQDQSRIPFELRIRGRIQADYYFYKTTDNLNHLTGTRYEPQVGDFSQVEVKRLRLFWEGNAFSPNLRYQFQIDGTTRGLSATPANRVVETVGTPPAGSFGAPGIGAAASTFGGGDVVDHALRLFTAWVAYDIPLGAGGKGCGPDCPEGTQLYRPILTFIVGKQQPFFGLTEILGSANAQLVDFAMADWFFDADDNNMLTAAAVQYRDFDDRLFATALLTNGNESQFANTQMDRLPGFNTGFWYDFGGSWNAQARRWDLYGSSLSDLDYSVKPVLRLGGAVNLVPMDRRSIYGDIEQSRVFVTPGGPGGTRIINLLNGDSGTPAGAHAVDKFDSYTFDAFASFHYRGFSLTNEWWLRQLTGFQTNPLGGNLIVYQDGSGANALFPGGNLNDFGTLVQAGYFIIPTKLEVVGRYSMR
jgi:hypothetical protein